MRRSHINRRASHHLYGNTLLTAMSLDHFPPEVGLRILDHLSPQECQHVLDIIQDTSPPPGRNTEIHRDITTWLYARMFGNTSVVYFDSSGPPEKSDFSATTGEMMARCRDTMFLANTPKHLSFRLVRDYQEVAKFQAALRACEKIIDNADLAEYYASIAKISFYLDAKYYNEVCSTSLSVAISCLLLKMTRLKAARVDDITVVGTNIGEVFPEKWDKVFNCHQGLQTLILDDNCLSLPEHENAKSAVQFLWPAKLKQLSMAGNRIRAFSMASMCNLPRTLEHLDISRNGISFFGALDGESFCLASHLPNMKRLILSDSRALARVDPSIFRGAAQLSGFVLDLSGCTLAPQNWDELEHVARAEKFMLLR